MSLESPRFVVPALLTLAWCGSAFAQTEASGKSFPWGLAILVAAALAVVATVLRSRAAARDAEAKGRDGDACGAPPTQPGMGGRVVGGLATGLAVGAGALAAQEIGRRMTDEHGQQGVSSGARSNPQTDSQLARDAGLGSIDGGSWDDGGSADMGGVDDGGSWDT